MLRHTYSRSQGKYSRNCRALVLPEWIWLNEYDSIGRAGGPSTDASLLTTFYKVVLVNEKTNYMPHAFD